MATDAEIPMALTMVGRPGRAIEVLTTQLPGLGKYPRDVVLTQAYLAEAHAAAGERDASAVYAEQARAGLAGGVQSPRTEAVLAALVA